MSRFVHSQQQKSGAKRRWALGMGTRYREFHEENNSISVVSVIPHHSLVQLQKLQQQVREFGSE